MEAVQWPNVVVDYPIFSEVNSPLKYASEELRDDREVVLWAIWNCADAYEFASEEIRSDTTAYLSAVRSAARPRTEIDPSHVPKRLYEDSNAFYQMLKSLGSTEELNSVLASYTAPQGYIVPVDDSDELFDYVGDTGMTHLSGFDDQIRSLFSDRDLLIQALNETSWAHYFVPKNFSRDSEVSNLAEGNRFSEID